MTARLQHNTKSINCEVIIEIYTHPSAPDVFWAALPNRPCHPIFLHWCPACLCLGEHQAVRIFWHVHLGIYPWDVPGQLPSGSTLGAGLWPQITAKVLGFMPGSWYA